MDDTQFICIGDSSPYNDLKKMKPFIKREKASFASIFNVVKPELDQVKEDLVNVHTIIKNDINTEREQIVTLETKLKNSSKIIKHSYLKVSKYRERNSKYSQNSKHFDSIKNNSEEIQHNLNKVKILRDEILDRFINIDSILPKSEQLLVSNSINEKHYPRLFAILKEKFPNKINKEYNDSYLDQQIPNLNKFNESELFSSDGIDVEQGQQLSLRSKSQNQIEETHLNSIHNLNNKMDILENNIPMVLEAEEISKNFINENGNSSLPNFETSNNENSISKENYIHINSLDSTGNVYRLGTNLKSKLVGTENEIIEQGDQSSFAKSDVVIPNSFLLLPSSMQSKALVSTNLENASAIDIINLQLSGQKLSELNLR